MVYPHFASPTSPCLRVFHGSERGLEAALRRKIKGENHWGKPMNNGDMNAKI